MPGELRRPVLKPTAPAIVIASAVLAAACGDGGTAPERPQPNRPPAPQGSIPAQTVPVGATVTVSVVSAFSDPDGDALTYSAASSAPGVASVTVSGADVAVTGVSVGTAYVTVDASDSAGLLAQQAFEVTVPNRPPRTTNGIPDQTVQAGDTVSLDLAEHFSEPDGDALTYAAESSAASVATAAASGASLTIAGVSGGSATLTVTASDPGGLMARQTFEVTVPNRAPVATDSIPDQTVQAGDSASLDLVEHFSDPDGDALTYAAESSASDVATAAASGTSLTIAGVSGGTATITVTASDPGGLMARQVFEVTVPNRAPAATDSIPDQTVEAADSLSADLREHFSDPDGDALTYAAESSAADVATVAVTGASLTIAGVSGGTATMTVTASDPEGLWARQVFEVTVPNRPPVAGDSIPGQTVQAGDSVTLDLAKHFSDPDGDALIYAAASSAAGVAFVAVSGADVTVTGVSVGTANVTVTASDPDGLSAQQVFEVTVPNRPPEAVGTIPGQTVTMGQSVRVDLTDHFRDPDGDALTYEASSGAPRVVSVSVSGSTLTLFGVAEGTATVTATAHDPAGMSARSAFTVLVSGGFHIELVFPTSLTGAQEAAFRLAAERWMTILAPTELPDFEAQNWSCGDDSRFERHVAIDDVMIVAVVEEIDGSGGTLARAGPCWVRKASRLPIYGRMTFDAADLERVEQRGDLDDLVLHEMGHVLGIGIIWDDLELLQDPASEEQAPDTHFTGPLAIAAFDEAGGRDYTGAKVPVENTGGSGH